MLMATKKKVLGGLECGGRSGESGAGQVPVGRRRGGYSGSEWFSALPALNLPVLDRSSSSR